MGVLQDAILRARRAVEPQRHGTSGDDRLHELAVRSPHEGRRHSELVDLPKLLPLLLLLLMVVRLTAAASLTSKITANVDATADATTSVKVVQDRVAHEHRASDLQEGLEEGEELRAEVRLNGEHVHDCFLRRFDLLPRAGR